MQDNIDALEGTILNTTSTNFHIPEINRTVRFLKEQIKFLIRSIPYKASPRILVIETVKFTVLYINLFMSRGGVSTTISPIGVITGTTLGPKKHSKV